MSRFYFFQNARLKHEKVIIDKKTVRGMACSEPFCLSLNYRLKGGVFYPNVLR